MEHATWPLGGLTPDDLQSQDRWLRSLVRSLVAESEVDDVVQQTWMAALKGKSGLQRPRPWLATVARRLAFRSHRTAQRRADHETFVAAEDVAPQTQEAWELVELQQHVLTAVQGLAEPYATTILLRYVQGQSTAEIAAQTGVSEGAARQRIKRGLEHLRTSVGARYQNDWRDLPALATWLGAASYSMKKSTVALGAVLAVGLAAVTSSLVFDDSGLEAIAQTGNPLEATGEQPPVDVSPVGGSVAESRIALEEAAEPLQAARGSFEGVALSPMGVPLSGVELGVVSPQVTTIALHGLPQVESQVVTDADGRFELPRVTESASVLPVTGLVPVASGRLHAESVTTRLVLVPSVFVNLVVRDEHRAVLDGVSVQVQAGGLKDFPEDLVGIEPLTWEQGTSDETGQVSLHDLPGGTGYLRLEKAGYVTQEVEIPSVDDPGLEVEMPSDPTRFTLRGWVRSPNGGGVAGAQVGLGDRTTLSAADGSFEIRIPESAQKPQHDILWAAHKPWRSAVQPGVGRRLCESPTGELEIELLFEGEPLAIEGRILKPNGEPYPGLTLFPWYQRHVTSERSAEELNAQGEPTLGRGRDMSNWAETDADGRFRLGFLQDQDYELFVSDMDRGLSAKTESVRAGTTNWTWTVPDHFELEELRGRVVDRYGKGVGGVTIKTMFLHYASDRTAQRLQGPQETVSAEDGAFRLEGVTGFFLMLNLSGPETLFAYHNVLPSERSGNLSVLVERRANFRLELTGERLAATWFEIQDSEGQTMAITAEGGGSFSMSEHRNITGGRTRVLTVGETAATLVLRNRDGDELDRLPLQLSTDGVETIAW